MIRTLIIGATGYTGIELIRLLDGHPNATIVAGTSRQWAGHAASDLFPYIPRERSFPLIGSHTPADVPEADVAFLCLPHRESASAVRPLMDAGLKVVDLSADCRIKDIPTYEEWYGPHPEPDIVREAVYGLPEIHHREAIRRATLVANPGCYPTTVILGLAPLAKLDSVDMSRPVADSKSGISGAGRGAKLTTSFCEAGESFKPYGVIGHRHIPEMEQELRALAGKQVKVRFTPHLVPMSRGIVSTLYVPAIAEFDIAQLRELYQSYYRDEPFVRILPAGEFPSVAHVRGSNMCHIGVELDERTGWVIVMSALDNLVKGASGAAVQNMNLMMGLPETAGLTGLPLYP